MSGEDKYCLTPKGHLINAILSMFPESTIKDGMEVWGRMNNSIYQHAGKSSNPDIADAEFIAIVLDGHGGVLIPIERDEL